MNIHISLKKTIVLAILAVGLLTAVVAVAASYSHRWTMQEVLMHTATQEDRTNRATEGFPDGVLYFAEKPLRHDSSAQSNCMAIPSASTSHTLATTSDYFLICASDNTALVRCDGSAATTTVGTGYEFFVSPGMCIQKEIEEAACTVIASAAGGVLCFDPLLVP